MVATASRSPNASYRPDIDGLRAVAVLAVLLFHAFPSRLPGGFIGVDVFFVISGFLITGIIRDGLAADCFSIGNFYIRRIRRIFPALCTVLVATVAFGWFWLLPGEFRQLGKHVAGGAGFVANLVFWAESGYFDTAAEAKPLLHLWSLGIEEQFYLLWPVLLWACWKKRLNFGVAATVMLLLSFAVNVATTYRDPTTAFYFPHTRLWELAAGGLLALYRPNGAFTAAFHKPAVRNAVAVLGALCLAAGMVAIRPESAFPGYWALLPVLGTVLLISAGPGAWINRVVLSNRWVVAIGLISYPLYLWHWPLLSFSYIMHSGPLSVAFGVGALAASFVLAWLTYLLVERPLRHGGHRNAKVAALAAVMAVIAAFGSAVYLANGFAFRFKSNIAMDEKAIEEERLKYWAEGEWDRHYETNSPKVMVFGDSQGFDVFKSLAHDSSLGLKNFESSFDCTAFDLPIRGKEDKAAHCKELFERLFKGDDLKRANVLIYTFSWSLEAEPPGAFEHYQAALNRLRAVNPDLKVFFLGPKPLLGHTWVSINSIIKDRKTTAGLNDYLNEVKWIREEDIQHVRALAAKLDVGFVDIVKVFCLDGCQFYEDGKFAYFDQNHWTGFGAQLFYDKLKRSGELARTLR